MDENKANSLLAEERDLMSRYEFIDRLMKAQDEVLALWIRGVDIDEDQNNTILRFKELYQQIPPRDDGYEDWADKRVNKLRADYNDLNKEFHPEVLRWYLSRDLFENERRKSETSSLTSQVALQPRHPEPVPISALKATAPAWGPGNKNTAIQSRATTWQKSCGLSMPRPLKTDSSPVLFKEPQYQLGRGGLVPEVSSSWAQIPLGNSSTLQQNSEAHHTIQERSLALHSNTPVTPHPKVPRYRQDNDSSTYPSAKGLPTPPRSSRSAEMTPRQVIEGFKPSRAVMGARRVLTPESIGRAISAGMELNPNFQSDLTEFNIENMKCRPEENCALRIENLATTATDKQVFQQIRDGRVFSFHRNDPLPPLYPNCAARLVFTTRAAAEAFLSRSRFPGISIHGHWLSVKWNRDRCKPVKELQRHQTRILRLTGPVAGPIKGFCAQWLENLFHTQVKFKLLDSKEWYLGNSIVVELSFSSILGQSRAAKAFFWKYLQENGLIGSYSISYAPDPCELASGAARSTSSVWNTR